MANKKVAPRNERSGAKPKKKKNTQKMAMKAYKRELKAIKKSSNKPAMLAGNKEQRMSSPKLVDQARSRDAKRMAREHYGNDVAKPAMKKTANVGTSMARKVTNTSKPAMAKRELHQMGEMTKKQNSLSKEALRKKVY